MKRHIYHNWASYLFYGFLSVIVVFAISQGVSQYKNQHYLQQLASDVISQAKATDQLSAVIAMRDYVRQHVSRAHYPARGRPYLRDSAADIIRSGKGRCGEATRAFIGLAATRGIQAQRLYLEGQRRHVVALVKLDSGERLIVDSSESPYIQNVESLDRLSQHSEFDYYSSFNRPRMIVSLPRNAVSLGPLGYYLENPHALKSAFSFLLGAGCLSLRLLPRRLLRRRKIRTKGNDVRENSWQTAEAAPIL